MKNILPILSVLLLSSCSFYNSGSNIKLTEGEQKENIEITQENPPVQDPGTGNKEKLSQNEKLVIDDFKISQTEDETLLSYKGKLVKSWSHNPPKNIPFVWDEACSVVWRQFEKLTGDDTGSYEAKQKIWSKLSATEKKECMKETLFRSIETNIIDNRFAKIKQMYYEGSKLWIFDSKNLYTQEIPAMGEIQKIEFSEGGITITILNDRGDFEKTILKYDENFSSLISQKDI